MPIVKPTLTSVWELPCSNFNGKSRRMLAELSFYRGRRLRLRRISGGRRLSVSCKVQDGGDNQQTNGNGEEPPESLFMKELKRRGMNPTSLLGDTKKGEFGPEGDLEEDRVFTRKNAVSTEIGDNLSNQREQSMALNSEGIEGLIPRAKLLLTIGGTFFLGFWPLILITVAFFSALYLYFGSAFIHDASKTNTSPPPYVDPYKLLEDERISKIAPPIN